MEYGFTQSIVSMKLLPTALTLRSSVSPVIPRLGFIKLSVFAIAGLFIASWFSILGQDHIQSVNLFSIEIFSRAQQFIKELLGIGSGSTPAFLKSDSWSETWPLASRTLAMSVLGTGIAGFVVLGTFIFGARNIMVGELAGNRNPVWFITYMFVRGIFIITRGVPELIWAMLIVFAFSPGILPGAIALAIHNSGILGKLAAEVVEDMDVHPVQALRTSGAGRIQVLFYGVLPEVVPRFLTLLMYRWEVIIRSTIVVGFVAAGGLGEDFRLSMSYFDYTRVSLIVLWYLALVLFVDLVAAALRRLAR